MAIVTIILFCEVSILMAPKKNIIELTKYKNIFGRNNGLFFFVTHLTIYESKQRKVYRRIKHFDMCYGAKELWLNKEKHTGRGSYSREL